LLLDITFHGKSSLRAFLFVSGKSLSVEVICDGDIAVAKAKGYVMGEVSSVELTFLERQTTSRVTFGTNSCHQKIETVGTNSTISR